MHRIKSMIHEITDLIRNIMILYFIFCIVVIFTDLETIVLNAHNTKIVNDFCKDSLITMGNIFIAILAINYFSDATKRM